MGRRERKQYKYIIKNRYVKADISKNVHITCIPPIMRQRLNLFFLWLIEKKEAHGYQIIKMMREDGHAVSASRLYPILNGMLADGLITQKEKMDGKRVRKVYVLAPKGKKELANGKEMFNGLIGEFLKEMSR